MKDRLHYLGLAVIVAAAGVVYALGIKLGLVHDYYSAAVYSMSKSWSAFLWGAVDGSTITLDKLPGAFWVQALSVRMFGFNDWALLLPQVAEALGAIVVTFFTVRRWLGATPGLIAAAALAVTPIVAALAHSEISDTLLMFLLTVAAYTWTRAMEKADWRWLALTGAVVGCAFQSKMAEAWGILPALALTYLAFGGATWLKRLGHLAIAGVTTAAFSLWWIGLTMVVSDRPWIDGSTTNSAWDMVFEYNLSGRYDSSGSMSSMWDADVMAQAGWFYVTAIVGVLIALWATRKAPRTDIIRAAALMSTLWFATYFAAFTMGQVNHSYYVVAFAPALAMMSVIGATMAWRTNKWLVAALAAVTLGWAAWLHSQFDFAQYALPVAVVLVALGGLSLLLTKRVKIAAPVAASMLVVGSLTTPAVWAAETVNSSGSAHSPYAGSGSGGMGGPGGGSHGGGSHGGGAPAGGRPGGSGHGPSGSDSAGNVDSADSSDSSATFEQASHSKSSGNPPSGAPGGEGSGAHGGVAPGGGSGGDAGNGSGSHGHAQGGQGGMGGSDVDAEANLQTIAAAGAGSEYDVAVIGYSAASEYITAGARVLFIGGYSGEADNVTLEQFQQLVADGAVTFIHLGGGGRGSLAGASASSAADEIIAWVQENFTEVADGLYQLTS